jgi:hypothetical protein
VAELKLPETEIWNNSFPLSLVAPMKNHKVGIKLRAHEVIFAKGTKLKQ